MKPQPILDRRSAVPFPATHENEAAFADKLASLRAEQQKAEEWLTARRARDSLPADSLS